MMREKAEEKRCTVSRRTANIPATVGGAVQRALTMQPSHHAANDILLLNHLHGVDKGASVR